MLLWFRERLLDARASSSVSKRLQNRLQSATSPREVCEAVADTLHANVIVVERNPGLYLVVAGSPFKPTMQALDLIAIELCFQSCQPSGVGSDQSAGSDWLFLPVAGDSGVAAVIGITGRYCRRRFDPSDASIRCATDALKRMYPATAD